MPISEFLDGLKFDPETKRVMGVAFEMTCAAFRLDKTDPIPETVAKMTCAAFRHTSQGERLVQKELRRTLLKYKLRTDQELFDKAYSYIRQYY
jgi:hypothetical protein